MNKLIVIIVVSDTYLKSCCLGIYPGTYMRQFLPMYLQALVGRQNGGEGRM